MRLIFLDIDGVLNSTEYLNSEEYEDEFKLHKQVYANIDPDKIKLLNKLVEHSGALVVLSSDWRLSYSLEEMNYFLKIRGATFQISDKTPFSGNPIARTPRGRDIQEYLDTICMKPESFVIIDDYSDMLHLKKYLVQTDRLVGITKEDIQKALEILEN